MDPNSHRYEPTRYRRDHRLSVFHLYGNPIAGDASRTPALGIIAVFLAGFAAALALMRRRDVSTA